MGRENGHKRDETNPAGEKSQQQKERVPYYKLFSFADSTDIVLMIVGTLGAIGNGMGMPLMTLLFGQMINSFGYYQYSDDIVSQVSKVKPGN